MAKNRKPNHNNRIVLAFAAIAFVYFAARYGTTAYNPIETTSAMRMTAEDSVSATGYFVRDELLVSSGTSDTVEYTVTDGEKVYRGAKLAMEYADEDALTASREIDTLKSSISLLTSVSQTAGDLSDVSKLDQLIMIQMDELNSMVDSGSISGLAQTSNNLRALTLERSFTSEDAATITGEIAKLKSQVNTLQQNIQSKTRLISSPYSGYFCGTVDGYEKVLRAPEIDKYTVSTFKKLKDVAPQQGDDNTMGKIVNGFSWYFAAVLPTSEAGKMEKGQQVGLRFAQASGEVPVTIYDIRPEAESGETLIVFQGMAMNEELVSMRKQSIDIIRHTYTGLKVPKEAVRMLDGHMGVYVLNGTVSKFKRVKPLYESDTFFIIEQSSANKDGVVVMDDIIIKAKELEDKKVVK